MAYFTIQTSIDGGFSSQQCLMTPEGIDTVKYTHIPYNPSSSTKFQVNLEPSYQTT
jgi:hypothetical protein